jgi:hypothetical protein
MTGRTRTLLWIVGMALVLGSFMGVGYCTVISRRSATSVEGLQLRDGETANTSSV